MNIAQGSLEDCLYYILLAKDLGFGDTKSIRVLSVKSVRRRRDIAKAGCNLWLCVFCASLRQIFFRIPNHQLSLINHKDSL